MSGRDVQIEVVESGPGTHCTGRQTGIRLALGAGAVIAAALLPLLRQQGVPSWDTVWAEDGWIFLQQAHDHGISALLRGYGGYLQLPPRLMAAPAPFVPAPHVALYFALASSTTCALLALFTYWASAGWIASRPVRAALASLVVVMPVLGQENTATITNTIWAFLAVAPWAFLARRDRRAGVACRGLVVFFAATSSPVAVVFAPLAIGCIVWRRDRPSWVVAGAFLTGLLLQAAVWANTTETRPFIVERDASTLPPTISIKVFAQYLLGDRGIIALWDQWRTVAFLSSLVVSVGLLLLLREAPNRSRVAAVALIGAGLATFLAAAWTRGTNAVAALRPSSGPFTNPALAGSYRMVPARYGVVPIFLLASAVAMLVAAHRRDERRWARGLRALFIVHVLVVCAVGFRVTNARSTGPAWPAAVEQARQEQCGGQSEGDDFSVPLPQAFFNPPVVLPCDG